MNVEHLAETVEDAINGTELGVRLPVVGVLDGNIEGLLLELIGDEVGGTGLVSPQRTSE